MALIGLVSVGLAGIFNLGTGNSMGVLYYREEDRGRRPTIIWSNATMLVIISLLLIPILIVAAPQISQWVFETPKYANFLRIAFFSLALITITDPFYAYLRMEEKAKQYVILTLISSLIAILLSVLLVLVLRWGVLGLLLAALFGQLLMLGIVAVVVARKLPFSINRGLFAPLVRIGFPSIFGLLAFLVIDYADRQLLQRMAGLDQLGIYSIGYSFGMVMMIFVSAFSTAWPPFFMSFINRRADAKIVFGKVLKYYIIGFGLLAVLFFAAAKPVVAVLVAPDFGSAFTVIGMVAAAYMLKGCYLILLPGIYFAGKLHWQSSIEWVAALLNIGLNLWWIPKFGITGAAGATLVSYMTLPVLSWAIGKRYLLVDYDWPKIGLAAFGFFVSGGVLFQVSYVESLREVLASSALAASVLFVFLLFAVLGNAERQSALNRAKSVLAGLK